MSIEYPFANSVPFDGPDAIFADIGEAHIGALVACRDTDGKPLVGLTADIGDLGIVLVDNEAPGLFVPGYRIVGPVISLSDDAHLRVRIDATPGDDFFDGRVRAVFGSDGFQGFSILSWARHPMTGDTFLVGWVDVTGTSRPVDLMELRRMRWIGRIAFAWGKQPK